MSTFLYSDIFLVSITFAIFFLAQLLQQKWRLLIFNPVLIAITIIILLLKMCQINYEDYKAHTSVISFFLKPAVVALGVPLYQQLEKIKKQAVIIIISQLIGCIVGVVSVVLIAKWMGASRAVILSLAPKSVTTPIAIEVSQTIGGIPPLTAAVVVVVGVFGAVYGYTILKWAKIYNPIAQSISMGTAAHAVGTSRSMDISPTYGAYASLGLISNGIFTSLLAPYILKILSYWIIL